MEKLCVGCVHKALPPCMLAPWAHGSSRAAEGGGGGAGEGGGGAKATNAEM